MSTIIYSGFWHAQNENCCMRQYFEANHTVNSQWVINIVTGVIYFFPLNCSRNYRATGTKLQVSKNHCWQHSLLYYLVIVVFHCVFFLFFHFHCACTHAHTLTHEWSCHREQIGFQYLSQGHFVARATDETTICCSTVKKTKKQTNWKMLLENKQKNMLSVGWYKYEHIENVSSFDKKHNPGEMTSLSESNHSH